MQFTEVYLVADNEAAIHTAQRGRVAIGASEYDLFTKLFRLQEDLRVPCSYRWVRCH